MYVGREFPIVGSVESRLLGFNFLKALDNGGHETISSVTFTLSVIEGVDSSPGSRLVGVPVVSGPIVSQRVSSLVSGCVYKLTAIALTNLGSTKSLWSRITCKD